MVAFENAESKSEEEIREPPSSYHSALHPRLALGAPDEIMPFLISDS